MLAALPAELASAGTLTVSIHPGRGDRTRRATPSHL